MPPRSQLPSEIKRPVFLKALEKNGFSIDCRGGKGNHMKAVYKNEKMVIIPAVVLTKDVLYYLLKEIEEVSSVTWDDIKRYL